RRAAGGRVETVRKEKPEETEGAAEAAAPAKKPARAAKPPRAEGGKAAKTSKQAPAKGPSRPGPSNRGAQTLRASRWIAQDASGGPACGPSPGAFFFSR